MVKSRTYIAKPGLTMIAHPSLKSVRILAVWREGMIFNRVDPTTVPGWPEFVYIASRIVFDPTVPFLGTPDNTVRETIHVLYDDNSN